MRLYKLEGALEFIVLKSTENPLGYKFFKLKPLSAHFQTEFFLLQCIQELPVPLALPFEGIYVFFSVIRKGKEDFQIHGEEQKHQHKTCQLKSHLLAVQTSLKLSVSF